MARVLTTSSADARTDNPTQEIKSGRVCLKNRHPIATHSGKGGSGGPGGRGEKED